MDNLNEDSLIKGIRENYDFVKTVSVENIDKCAGAIRSALEYAVKLFWLKKYGSILPSYELCKATSDKRFSQHFSKMTLRDMDNIRQTCNEIIHQNDTLALDEANDLIALLEKCIKAIENAISMKIISHPMEELAMPTQLKNLITAYLQDFKSKKDLDMVVKDSIPIIWFGDLERYNTSEVKIVTVGLNPSWHEFWESEEVPLIGREKRFDDVDLSEINDKTISALYETLNEYFYINSYKYFNQYEQILRGMGFSFYLADKKNIAVHVDAYTPIATNPFFGELAPETKNIFKATGMKLFKELMAYLDPDIVLISIAKNDFDEIYPYVKFIDSYVDPDKKGLYINIYLKNQSGKRQIIIHGRNFKGTPFGGRTCEETSEILQNMISSTKKSL